MEVGEAVGEAVSEGEGGKVDWADGVAVEEVGEGVEGDLAGAGVEDSEGVAVAEDMEVAEAVVDAVGKCLRTIREYFCSEFVDLVLPLTHNKHTYLPPCLFGAALFSLLVFDCSGGASWRSRS